MRILGVDPGLRVTGYGAIESAEPRPRLLEAGIIAPDLHAPLERRLGTLYEEMCVVLRSTRPDVMVVEQLWTAYRNPTTAVLMGHARGVICLAASTEGVAVRHLVHSLVKRALVGFGAARKEQVKRMVAQHLGLRALPGPDDLWDALALALALVSIDQTDRRFAAVGARPAR
ncbi:MAG: crossover junction endodeoxyribonuclease RuvC [Candidatus Eremiobacteraeota bacterium]|nr:crossover junction endodeoxyribonuclease RuvC [Candidatus Eremiobacteraeota bacterium]MBV9648130.1 crossover junction endodeoxyribonuclease RuvC [Candidatus Eremiobacteraeota bacterium]